MLEYTDGSGRGPKTESAEEETIKYYIRRANLDREYHLNVLLIILRSFRGQKRST